MCVNREEVQKSEERVAPIHNDRILCVSFNPIRREIFSRCPLTACKQGASPLIRALLRRGLTLGEGHKWFFSIGASVLAESTTA